MSGGFKPLAFGLAEKAYEKLKGDEDKPAAVAPTTPAITQADVDASITKSREEDARKREELRMGRKAKGEGTATTAVRV